MVKGTRSTDNTIDMECEEVNKWHLQVSSCIFAREKLIISLSLVVSRLHPHTYYSCNDAKQQQMRLS
jgi:hypothetical protein